MRPACPLLRKVRFVRTTPNEDDKHQGRVRYTQLQDNDADVSITDPSFEITYDDVNGWSLPEHTPRVRRLSAQQLDNLLDDRQINIPCELQGKKVLAVLDTGSHVTAVNVDWLKANDIPFQPAHGKLITLDPLVISQWRSLQKMMESEVLLYWVWNCAAVGRAWSPRI